MPKRRNVAFRQIVIDGSNNSTHREISLVGSDPVKGGVRFGGTGE
jgi:hypothetical protein